MTRPVSPNVVLVVLLAAGLSAIFAVVDIDLGMAMGSAGLAQVVAGLVLLAALWLWLSLFGRVVSRIDERVRRERAPSLLPFTDDYDARPREPCAWCGDE